MERKSLWRMSLETFVTWSIAANFVVAVANAKTAKQAVAIEKAEQSVRLAECKLDNLQNKGLKVNSKEYFAFMADCMGR